MTPGERAKAFVDEILIPPEIDAELGRLTACEDLCGITPRRAWP